MAKHKSTTTDIRQKSGSLPFLSSYGSTKGSANNQNCAFLPKQGVGQSFPRRKLEVQASISHDTYPYTNIPGEPGRVRSISKSFNTLILEGWRFLVLGYLSTIKSHENRRSRSTMYQQVQR
ncbi:hypothetical protein ACMFMG_003521 [Clarireedia jacksonii]